MESHDLSSTKARTMTPCTTFVNGVNPFLAAKPDPLTALQRVLLAALKEHGPIRASVLADKLDMAVISVREALHRMEHKELILKRSGTRWPVYFLKETMQ